MRHWSSFLFQRLGLLALTLGFTCAAWASQALYQNPVLAGDYPDPSVIRVGDDYWATATSSEWGPQFPILHSRDLVNWEVVGAVFDQRPDWAVGNFWAPEIQEWKGRYYIYYVGRKRGGPLTVAVATAERPQGPYVDHGPIISQEAGSIDAVAVDDEHGSRYLVWKEDGNSRKLPTILWAARLNPEGTQLTSAPQELLRNDSPWEGAVVEGPFLVRRDGWFYLFYSGSGCCGSGCNYALGVARSRALLGPWEKHPANPIMAGNRDWRCPGHGSIVEDPQGRHWLLYHAYASQSFVFTGRQMLLDQVEWNTNGWPTINNGQGPTVRRSSPFGVAPRRTEYSFQDEFTNPALRPGWNWPVTNKPEFTFERGHLLLSPRNGQTDLRLGGVLARAITRGDFEAKTTINTSDGASGGLAAIGDLRNATGIAVAEGKLQVWHRAQGRETVLAEAPVPAGNTLHLRLSAVAGQHYRFAFSPDGQHWTGLGDSASGQHLPPWDRAVRVGLTAGKKAARFDHLTIRSAPQ